MNVSQITTVKISEYCAVNNFFFFALIAAYNEDQTNTHKKKNWSVVLETLKLLCVLHSAVLPAVFQVVC